MRLRLQKFIAQAGICSRRAAEVLIKEGRVAINNGQIAQIGDSVDPSVDKVQVDGQHIGSLQEQYLIYHKPPKVMCSRGDTYGRHTLYDDLPSHLHHLFYAGRLDFLSEGLVVLTNDGHFKQQLTHPRFRIEKQYHVWVRGLQDPHSFREFARTGIRDGEDLLKAKRVSVISQQKGLLQLEIILEEGKYREIRRMIHAAGAKVVRLLRLRVGDLSLRGLNPARWRNFQSDELNFVSRLNRDTSYKTQ